MQIVWIKCWCACVITDLVCLYLCSVLSRVLLCKPCGSNAGVRVSFTDLVFLYLCSVLSGVHSVQTVWIICRCACVIHRFGFVCTCARCRLESFVSPGTADFLHRLKKDCQIELGPAFLDAIEAEDKEALAQVKALVCVQRQGRGGWQLCTP